MVNAMCATHIHVHTHATYKAHEVGAMKSNNGVPSTLIAAARSLGTTLMRLQTPNVNGT